ncbi:hypothetical protein B0H17DRAFT_915143 [Mycena rosella]|uniref:Uncharacterized protein n=1 Tax=Mycena rosella TaxID=1033263 RepID=A0AAD7MBR2_MYCRO|nr:hypothetical protein B0H17DRAFT_915143 [Mycena rosella]
MLLKFTSQDLFDTALVDVSTGKPVFHLRTNVVPGPSSGLVRRQTEIRDGGGAIVGTIEWLGRVPQDIRLLDESVGGLVDLFASDTIQFIPKEISIPTRFDTEYIWTATPEALYLLDYDSDTRQAQLHTHAPALKATHAPIPGRGAAYLELSPHPLGLAPPVEILVSLLMLDVLRRGRFGLPPYAFAPPSRLQAAWSRLRPRRNTV